MLPVGGEAMNRVDEIRELVSHHTRMVADKATCNPLIIMEDFRVLLAEIDVLINERARLQNDLQAHCGDGGCIFGHGPGMHTNGGCRCLCELPLDVRVVMRRRVMLLRQERDRLARFADEVRPWLIGAVARERVPVKAAKSALVLLDETGGKA